MSQRSRSQDQTPEPRLVARALYNFVGQSSRELTFRRGDLIFVRRQVDKNWYEGEYNAMIGLFPSNYVEVIASWVLEFRASVETREVKVGYVPPTNTRVLFSSSNFARCRFYRTTVRCERHQRRLTRDRRGPSSTLSPRRISSCPWRKVRDRQLRIEFCNFDSRRKKKCK